MANDPRDKAEQSAKARIRPHGYACPRHGAARGLTDCLDVDSHTSPKGRCTLRVDFSVGARVLVTGARFTDIVDAGRSFGARSARNAATAVVRIPTAVHARGASCLAARVVTADRIP